MKKTIKAFLTNSINFSLFVLKIISTRFYSTNIKSNVSGKVAVFANGPSLKDDLDTFISGVSYDNYVVLNNFAFDKKFEELKPSHYCLADPMYFVTTHRIETVSKLYKELETKVTWSMNLYIPYNCRNKFNRFSNLTNPLINVVYLNTNTYSGFDCFRNFFYAKGFAMPRVQTVANMAVYVAINLGYKNVDLYGFDHTFFDSMMVDDDNRLCNKETHFYSNSTKIELKPIIRNDNDQIFKISDYLSAISKMFYSHDLLRCYADNTGSKITNCSSISLIDSYERKPK
ncbi:hypothetical protein JCM19236_5002 [Vibrio sp. JCM 19236]|nr:hypothetical protein JCM19236_5002 [Vibrio sp. JCM 19236]